MTKILLLLLLLSLNLIKSNQLENHTSTYVSICQSILLYYSNNTGFYYCGTNCTNIRYCYSIDDYYENYFDNKICDNQEDKIIDFNKKEYFQNFEVNTRNYLQKVTSYIITIIITFLLIIISIFTILWICSFKINKNLTIYQYLTTRYYFVYRLFGTNIEILDEDEDTDEHDDDNDSTTISSSKSTSSASTSNLSKKSTGFEIKLLNKLYAKNKFNLRLLKSKNDEKLKLLDELIDSGILIKFDDIDEKFELKKFDNNLMTQKVLNLHQYIENIRKIKIK